MSGVDWIPGLGVGRHGARRPVPGRLRRARDVRQRANWYSDDGSPAAQVRLAGEAADGAGRAPGALGVGPWQRELELRRSRPIRTSAVRWLAGTTGAIRSADPAQRSRSASTWRTSRRIGASGPAEAAEACDFLSMHGYPIYAAVVGRADRRAAGAVPRADHALAGRRGTCCSRSSACPRHLAEGRRSRRSSPRTPRRATRGGCSTGCVWPDAPGACSGATATTTPGSGTIPPLDEAVHERSFGLWRADGSAKPAVGVVGAFAGATRSAASRRRLDRHRRRPLLAAARHRAPASVRPLQGDADRPGVTPAPVTAPSRHPRAARSVGGVPWYRGDT